MPKTTNSACLERLACYPEVIQERAEHDPMNDGVSYDIHGRVMLDAVRMAMLAAHKASPSNILDFPSGYGRALRYLRAEFPEAKLSAGDIDHRAVDFCASTFGATPIYSREHSRDIELAGGYDLIWCGSFLTHLDAAMWDEFLDLFVSVLAPGGLFVFSTPGRYIASVVKDPDKAAGWAKVLGNDHLRLQLLDGYESGFGYIEYPTQDPTNPSRYGLALARPSWVLQRIERREQLQMTSYTEGRWGAQDVIGCVKVTGISERESAVQHTLG